MQESRLFQIVYYLLDKGQATAPELAERFEVSVRTIYRDIDALSGAGIPVYAEAGRNGGIRLMNDFVLDQAVLSKEEKQDILSALQSILHEMIAGLTETELHTPFDFSENAKREAHWKRDKNLRDVLIHLYEWHELLLT